MGTLKAISSALGRLRGGRRSTIREFGLRRLRGQAPLPAVIASILSGDAEAGRRQAALTRRLRHRIAQLKRAFKSIFETSSGFIRAG
jgi:hypothetical protein